MTLNLMTFSKIVQNVAPGITVKTVNCCVSLFCGNMPNVTMSSAVLLNVEALKEVSDSISFAKIA